MESILQINHLNIFLKLVYNFLSLAFENILKKLFLSGKTNNEVKDGLKAQKHIAQGIALGKHYIPTYPSALKGQKPNY